MNSKDFFTKQQQDRPQASAAEKSAGNDRNCSTSKTSGNQLGASKAKPDLAIHLQLAGVSVELQITLAIEDAEHYASGNTSGTPATKSKPEPVIYRYRPIQESVNLFTDEDPVTSDLNSSRE